MTEKSTLFIHGLVFFSRFLYIVMPSRMNLLIYPLQAIAESWEIRQKVNDELALMEAPQLPHAHPEKALSLSVKHLCFSYGDKEVLKDLSFTLRAGRGRKTPGCCFCFADYDFFC